LVDLDLRILKGLQANFANVRILKGLEDSGNGRPGTQVTRIDELERRNLRENSTTSYVQMSSI